MSAIAQDARTLAVLWRRDLLLFFRQRSRIAGALAQPLLFWLAFGSGMAPTFRLRDGGVGYLAYAFPGTVLMLVLFAAISATMSVIEDRHQGFLQGVLAAPGSRVSIVLGKSLGSTTVALLQAALFLLLAPLAGYAWGTIAWLPLAAMLALVSLALTAIGFALAWWIDSTQGYHVVMSVLLIPLWMLSGALFPAEGLHPVLGAIVRANPLSFATSGLRRALHGGTLPAGTAIAGASAATEFGVVAGLAAAALGVAGWVCGRHGGD